MEHERQKNRAFRDICKDHGIKSFIKNSMKKTDEINIDAFMERLGSQQESFLNALVSYYTYQ